MRCRIRRPPQPRTDIGSALPSPVTRRPNIANPPTFCHRPLLVLYSTAIPPARGVRPARSAAITCRVSSGNDARRGENWAG